MIVLSGSVAAATLGGRYETTAKGLVVLAPAVLPAMTMATAYGTLAGQTSIEIASGSSTLAGGFATGTLVPAYASTRSVGWPAATLKVAVVASGTTTQVTIFRDLRGSAMVGGYLAPGRRAGTIHRPAMPRPRAAGGRWTMRWPTRRAWRRCAPLPHRHPERNSGPARPGR